MKSRRKLGYLFNSTMIPAPLLPVPPRSIDTDTFKIATLKIARRHQCWSVTAIGCTTFSVLITRIQEL